MTLPVFLCRCFYDLWTCAWICVLRTQEQRSGSARPHPGTAVTLRSMTCSKPSEQASADSTSGSKSKAKQGIAVTLRSMTCSKVGQLSTRQEKKKSEVARCVSFVHVCVRFVSCLCCGTCTRSLGSGEEAQEGRQDGCDTFST